MANVFGNLIPNVVASMSEVARSEGALFNLLETDAKADAASVGQSVQVGVQVPRTAYTVTPAATAPALSDMTPTVEPFTISNYFGQRFHLSAEEQRALANGEEVKTRAIEQAISDVIALHATSLFNFLNSGAGYALGAQGTDPFASTPNITMDLWKILTDEKAPANDRMLALSVGNFASAGKLQQFQKLSEAPRGVDFATAQIAMLANSTVSYSQDLVPHVRGTANGSYVTSGSSAAGTSTLTLISGSGTILAGDVVTFAADTANKYIAQGFTGGVLTLNAPLKTTIPTGNAVTVAAAHGVSLGGSRRAGIASFRPPLVVNDAATESEIVTDPVTGLSMRLAYYPGYHTGQWEVSMVSGFGWRRRNWMAKLIS